MHTSKIKQPWTVKAILVFIFLNSMLWLSFGINLAFDRPPIVANVPIIKWSITGVSLLLCITLMVLILHVMRRKRFAYWLTLTLLAGTIMLTIIYEFGALDFIMLVINLVPFTLLLIERRWFLHQGLIQGITWWPYNKE